MSVKQLPFWLQLKSELLREAGFSADGLSSDQAQQLRRLAEPPTRRGWWRLLAATWSNPLVWVLLAASAASAALGETSNAVLIISIVGASSLLEFSQTFRSTRAAERFRAQVATRASVLRDGRPREIPLQEIVPGDVVLLTAGSLVARRRPPAQLHRSGGCLVVSTVSHPAAGSAAAQQPAG